MTTIKTVEEVAKKVTTGFMQHYNWEALFTNKMTEMVRAHLEKEITEAITKAWEAGRESVIPTEHTHEWITCPGLICTSDFHTHHCKTCGKHAIRTTLTQNSNRENV